MRRHRFAPLILLAVLILAACAGRATPDLISAYRPDAAQPIATYIAPPVGPVLTYDAYLEIRTKDPAASAASAAHLAADLGGYLASTQRWTEDSREHASVTLTVPAANFDALHTYVLSLGDLDTERVTGSLVPNAYPSQVVYATLTVHFLPNPPLVTLPRLPNTGWSPARTFANAFTLFATIFTFLLDILIWLAVVLGPFALMALGLRTLARRLRAR